MTVDRFSHSKRAKLARRREYFGEVEAIEQEFVDARIEVEPAISAATIEEFEQSIKPLSDEYYEALEASAEQPVTGPLEPVADEKPKRRYRRKKDEDSPDAV